MIPLKGRGYLLFHGFSSSVSPALWNSVAHSRTAAECPVMDLLKCSGFSCTMTDPFPSCCCSVTALFVCLKSPLRSCCFVCLFEESFVVSRHFCGTARARGDVVLWNFRRR